VGVKSYPVECRVSSLYVLSLSRESIAFSFFLSMSALCLIVLVLHVLPICYLPLPWFCMLYVIADCPTVCPDIRRVWSSVFSI
jgi:hypothetical protein